MAYTEMAIRDLHVTAEAALALFRTASDEKLDEVETMLIGLMETEEGYGAEVELLFLQFGRKLVEEN